MIFHLDLDSFFVSAERLVRPELRGIPVAVGGSTRGVISSASYEARKFGVRSAMPSVQARRICPQLLIVKSTSGLYSKLSRQVFAILSRFSPTLEAVSIDEAYLDMAGTEALWGDPLTAANRIREAIRVETGLPASIGIGTNRRIAKIATDYAKPDGVKLVPAGQEKAFLAPLSVGKVPGIGPKTTKWLEAHGAFRIADLQGLTRDQLERKFPHHGDFLFDVAEGGGSTKFHEESKVRSMSREETFDEDIRSRTELKKTLWEMVSDLGSDLRAEESSKEGEETKLFYAHAVRVKIRYPNFETIVRSRVLTRPSRIDREIFAKVEEVFEEAWETGKPVRLIGAGIVLGDGVTQLGLFEAPPAEGEKVDALKDELRKKFGKKALLTGRDLA